MIAVKIIVISLGIAFCLFGFFIYFRKKYNLINGFEEDHHKGRKKEQYAKRVGMAEFITGIALIITGILLIVLV